MDVNNKHRVIIVDDEKLARKRISDLLSSFEESFMIIKECSNGSDAVREILLLKPDLVFLDIQMPVFNGYEVIEKISKQQQLPAIIFTTAYDTYAVKAFEVNAIDYLLKPYADDRFNQAIQKVKENWILTRKEVQNIMQVMSKIEAFEIPIQQISKQKITLKKGNSIFIRNIKDIDWIEAYGEYVKIHIEQKVFLKRISLKEMNEALSDDFSRIHRSFIVNKDRIKEIKKTLNGFYNMYLFDGTKLRISPNYKDKLGL